MRLNRKALIIVLILVGIILGNGLLEGEKQKLLPRAAGEISLTQMFLEFIGELRYTLASLLWVKSDLWFHEIEQHQDWRLVKDLLPLFKAITVLDPHFVEAYDLGGYQLGSNLKEYRTAEEFLKEGLHNNPESLLLILDMTAIYFEQKRFGDALPWARKAVAMAFSDTHTFKSDEEAWNDRFNASFYLSHIALSLHLWDDMVDACDKRISLNGMNLFPTIMKMNVPNWRFLLEPV